MYVCVEIIIFLILKHSKSNLVYVEKLYLLYLFQEYFTSRS